VKALPRHGEGKPGGGEAQEGIGSERQLNPVSTTTDFHTEQSPAGGAIERGAGSKIVASATEEFRQRAVVNDERATATDEVVRLCGRENP